MDEDGQTTLAVSFGLLTFASKFVLVGNHYQLPPLIQSAEARENGMTVSLFCILSEAHPQAICALQSQYRMCAAIMELSNALIYGHRLRCGSSQVENAKIKYTTLPSGPTWIKEVLNLTEIELNWVDLRVGLSGGLYFMDRSPQAVCLLRNLNSQLVIEQLCFAAKTWYGGFLGMMVSGASEVSRNVDLGGEATTMMCKFVIRASDESITKEIASDFQGWLDDLTDGGVEYMPEDEVKVAAAEKLKISMEWIALLKAARPRLKSSKSDDEKKRRKTRTKRKKT